MCGESDSNAWPASSRAMRLLQGVRSQSGLLQLRKLALFVSHAAMVNILALPARIRHGAPPRSHPGHPRPRRWRSPARSPLLAQDDASGRMGSSCRCGGIIHAAPTEVQVPSGIRRQRKVVRRPRGDPSCAGIDRAASPTDPIGAGRLPLADGYLPSFHLDFPLGRGLASCAFA